jgi:hypothetical protein
VIDGDVTYPDGSTDTVRERTKLKP